MFFFSQPREEFNIAIAKPLSKSRLLFLLTITMFIWLGYRQVQKILTPPQAVLVLGGHEERERYAAKLARQYPELPIWVSSGSPQDYARRIFLKEGIEGDRLHLDYRARDTVTNFTTLVDELKARKIKSIYLVTSENHMTRARIIGEIVFGSRGIVFRPISVPSENPPEPIEKCLRDGARSIIWLITGRTGVMLLQSWQKTLYL
jgi:uncharacterized SAM-binding protein YcdF (DUF218 family)